jgi:hypothetical protein
VPAALPLSSGRSPRIARFALGCALALASCQALPPPAHVDAREGVVRAGSPEEARAVAEALDALLPEVLAFLPDAHARPVEVWVQEEPTLYTFPRTSTYRDADGFFSDRLDRIHLRSGADDLRRTLAHELVHASLGRSWRGLPGTIEEGLCDLIAIQLCPESASRLRAGRLLAAALELGGFDLEYSEPGTDASADPTAGARYVQHVFSMGERTAPLDPLEVFRAHAGRSTALMPGDVKKALYGLAFLVTERIVERRGIAGLHALVVRSGRSGTEPSIELLLGAAELTRERDTWRRAIAAALGPAEVAEITRILPGISVARTVSLRMPDAGPVKTAARLDVRCVRP